MPKESLGFQLTFISDLVIIFCSHYSCLSALNVYSLDLFLNHKQNLEGRMLKSTLRSHLNVGILILTLDRIFRFWIVNIYGDKF